MKDSLLQKKISIFGMSKMGISAAKLVQSLGAEIFISESKTKAFDSEDLKLLRELNIDYEIGQNTEKVLNADLIIKSPGIPISHPLLVQAQHNAIPIIGEIDFALSFFNGISKFICVTGSNGKTTATTLLCHILKMAGRDCLLTGHRNMPLSEMIYQGLAPEFIIQEVSCSDLRDNHHIRPDLGVILNIYSDHLDLFGNMDEYAKIKFKLLKNQTPHSKFFINSSIQDYIKYFYPKKINYEVFDKSIHFKNIPDYFKGIEEVLSAVYEITNSLGIDDAVFIEGINTYASPPHRRQIIHLKNGAILINDAKGTNVQALLNALQWIQKPVILIAGGKDKGQDYSCLKELFKQKVNQLIAIGSTGKRLILLADELNVKNCFAPNLIEAVQTAFKMLNNNDFLLYCPGSSHEGSVFDSAEEAGEYLSLL